jgi:peptidoglycan endopeptidase LytE
MYKASRILILAGAVTASSFLIPHSEASAASGSPVNVQVDNELVRFPDAQPFIDENSRTQVPFGFLSQKMGYKVNWRMEENHSVKVTIQNENTVVVIRTGENKATVNGQTVTLDTKAALREDRTFVPMSFVAEALGSKAKWDGNSHTAILITGKTPASEIKPVLASRSPVLASRSGMPMAAAKPSSPNVADIAKSYVGAPYAWGGTTPGGFDCSGFVQYVFGQKGIQLPRTAADMYKLGTPVSSLQPGDLVFYSTYGPGATHVGIYIGDNQFISSTSSSGVKIVPMNNPYWGPRYIGAKRL